MLTFKQAEPKDMAVLLSLIKELAAYENLEHEVTATEEILTEWLFEKKKAEVRAKLSAISYIFIIFPRFWAKPAYMWKIYLFSLLSVTRATANSFCSILS